jgi:hypothetical protein
MCKQRDCLGYTGKVDSPPDTVTELMSGAFSRLDSFRTSMQKFMDEVGKILDETKTDEFADYGDPIHSIEDIENLFESYKGYLKKEFEKSP